MSAPPPKKHFTMPREIRIILSVGILVFVFEYLVLPQFALARQRLHLLSSLNPLVVALAILFEMAAIYSYVELTRTVLYPYSPGRWNTLRVNLAGLAISHVVPGGTAPAGALSYRIFNELGVPKETNAFGLATQGSGSAVVLNIIFWMALVISIPLRGFNPAYGFAALAGVFLLAAFFGTILLIIRGQRHADNWLRAAARHMPALDPDKITTLLGKVAERIRVLVNNRRTLWWAFTWAGLNWLFDATCLWVFIWSFGHVISPIDLLVAYGLANILAAIPLTPGGLGVVEGVLIPTLVGFGVPHSQAILAVIAYRLVNFWIPIPLGGIAYASLQWRRGLDVNAAPTNGPDSAPDA
jgi:uncharacterized protein (TIRG00374 family)